MSSTHVRSALGALAICAIGWLGLAEPAGATPRQVVTEYSGTLEASRPTRSAAPAPDESFKPEDAIDWAKDNIAPIIVVGGVLLVVGTWKMISR